VPASPWLSESAEPLSAPKITVTKSGGSWVVSRDKKANAAPWLWVVRTKHDGKWHVKVLPGTESDCPLNFVPKNESPVVAVSVVDRIGQESSLSWYGGKDR
jgi:hypothetical protein